MALKNERVSAPAKGSREAYELSYTKARSNLLLAAIFTLVNVFLVLSGSDTYFLFSASIPYWAGVFGRFDYEIYGVMSSLVIAGVIAVVFTAVYFILWGMSKRHRGWMYAAAVCFAVDFLGLILLNLDLGFDSSDIMDYLFHVYVMIYLISGSVSAGKLAKMPPKEVASCDYAASPAEGEAIAEPEAPAAPETTDAPEAAETPAEAIPTPEAPETGSEIPDEENIPLVDGRKDYRGQTIGANYYRGLEAVGGVLSFDEAGMTFRSHALNIQTGDTRIEYKDIERAQTRGMLTEISVHTKDGQDHRFVVFHRNDVVAFLESVKG